MSGHFDSRSPQDLADLIAGHPLAWLCTRGPEGLLAAPLPLLPHWAADGTLAGVEGHLPRTHALVAALQAEPQALVLWMGVQGYVSPSWLGDRTQAPSWTYAAAQARLQIVFDDDEALLAAHLERLSAAHEAGRAGAWQPAEMGERFARLARRVIAFRGTVSHLQQRYKLGQDERDDTFAAQLAQLDGTPLAAWMRRFNPQRGTRRAAELADS
jgi:transcriptional regulator